MKEMIRIVNVVQNRIASEHYAKSPCEVISQKQQFSWTSNHNNNIQRINRLILKDKKELLAWQNSLAISRLAMMHKLPDITKGSTSYHIKKMHKPHSCFWKHMKKVLASQFHIYYTDNRYINKHGENK